MSNPNQQDGAITIAPGTVIDGRYKVVKSLGQGGNGLVHEVEHVRTGRRLALKSLLDESGQGRLEQEARATCLLMNDHAARITDMGSAQPVGPYLVMELLEGQNLRTLLDDASQLPLELVVNIALQVCECLAEAHKHGIVHRDLKPENVFLSSSPWPGQYDVRVLDFGVVKIGSEGPIPNASLTRTGSTVGTPYYMSLEQLRNSSAVDARADIYALGVVMYESLSGRKPFTADTIGDLVYALCSGPPTNLARLRPDLPAELTAMVMRALSMKKEERPASMNDFGAALLPHGNPAFGLWVRVGGKQPALAARAAGKGSSLAPRQTTAVVPGAPGGPPRPAPGAIADPESASTTMPRVPIVGGPPRVGGAPKPGVAPPLGARPTPEANEAPGVGGWTDAALEGGPTAQAEDRTSSSEGRRDTPTEMYKQDDHGELEVAPNRSGDRDTPTRAIPAASLLEEQARRGRADTQALKAFATDEPTGDLPAAGLVRRPSGIAVSGATLPLGDMGMLQTMPAPVQQQQQQAMGMVGAPGAQLPVAMNPGGDNPFKPAWQRSLDAVLVSVGKNVDDWIAKFKASPPKTRVLLIICMASVALFFAVLFAFLIIH